MPYRIIEETGSDIQDFGGRREQAGKWQMRYRICKKMKGG